MNCNEFPLFVLFFTIFCRVFLLILFLHLPPQFFPDSFLHFLEPEERLVLVILHLPNLNQSVQSIYLQSLGLFNVDPEFPWRPDSLLHFLGFHGTIFSLPLHFSGKKDCNHEFINSQKVQKVILGKWLQ